MIAQDLTVNYITFCSSITFFFSSLFKELDMTSSFVRKAALIAMHKLEQKPKLEKKEKRKMPEKEEYKTGPEKSHEEREVAKKVKKLAYRSD